MPAFNCPISHKILQKGMWTTEPRADNSSIWDNTTDAHGWGPWLNRDVQDEYWYHQRWSPLLYFLASLQTTIPVVVIGLIVFGIIACVRGRVCGCDCGCCQGTADIEYQALGSMAVSLNDMAVSLDDLPVSLDDTAVLK
jgi:hypothetical protein